MIAVICLAIVTIPTTYAAAVVYIVTASGRIHDAERQENDE